MNCKQLGFWLACLTTVEGSFYGCSNVESARRVTETSTCPTVVEGFFHSRVKYVGRSPAISVIRSTTPAVLHGEIKRMDKAGICFLPERESIFYNSDTIFYSYDKIQWIADKEGNVLYGTLPEKNSGSFDMEFEIIDQLHPDAKHTALKFQANKRFSFCVKPGEYTISKISLEWAGLNEEATSFPPMKMDVKPNSVNYVGDFYLDLHTDTLQNVLKIGTSITSPRPVYIGMQGGVVGGAIAGAIAGLAQALIPPDSSAHYLSIAAISTFATQLQLPVTNSIIQVLDSTNYRNK